MAIGPRPAGDDQANEAACRYIEETLEELGYAPRRETFEAEVSVLAPSVSEQGKPLLVLSAGVPVVRANVVAELVGESDPSAVVEVGAHYDTVPASPGANDNASGVAALLEIARVLRGVRPDRTVRLVFFGLEETGFHGSRAHVAALPESEHERFVGLLNLDMVGVASREPGTQRSPVRVPFLSWGKTADFVAVLGNFSSGWIGNVLEDSFDAYVPGLAYYSLNRIGSWFADGHRSDHVPYWQAGLRAVHVTDTGEFRSPHYHARSDLPNELDFDFLASVTRGTAAAVLHLAGWRGEEP